MSSFFSLPRVRAGLLSILAGVAYSVAAPMYAKACYAAPTIERKIGITSLEFVYFIPTLVFAIAGVAGLIIGTCMLVEEAEKFKSS